MTKFLGGQNEFAFVGIFFWAKDKKTKHLSIYEDSVDLVWNKTHQLNREAIIEHLFFYS